jgi:predicted nucleotidyltransferase
MPDESVHPLHRVAEVLLRHGVEFVVVGGQAEALMGSPRVTYDTDLCYRRTEANIQRLASALQELNISLRGAPAGLPFRPDAQTLEAGLNFTFQSTAGPLDLLGEVEPVGGYDTVASRAETYDVWGMRLRTISLDDLIRVKRHIARGKDSESLFQLLAIKRVREEMRGQGPAAAPGPGA